MTQKVVFEGLPEVMQVLDELVPRVSNNLKDAVVRSIASEIVKEARARVPTDTGTLKKAIKVKSGRDNSGNKTAAVVIEHGKNAHNDGYYWYFVEYGTGGDNPQGERPFLRPAADVVTQNMKAIIEQQFTKKLRATVRRELKKKAAKK